MDRHALPSAGVVELLPEGHVSEAAHLHQLVNIREFEQVARARLTHTAYSYIASGAEDEVGSGNGCAAYRSPVGV